MISEYSDLSDFDEFWQGYVVLSLVDFLRTVPTELMLDGRCLRSLHAAMSQEFAIASYEWISRNEDIFSICQDRYRYVPWDFQIGDIIVYAMMYYDDSWCSIALPLRIWDAFTSCGCYAMVMPPGNYVARGLVVHNG